MSLYLAAEIGPTVTSLETALQLVEVIAQAGFDAVKVQMLDHERLVGDPALEVTWRNAGGQERRAPMREILARRHLSADDWTTVFRQAEKRALDIIATVDFPATLDLALKLGAGGIKVCSGDLNNTAWIREVGQAAPHVLLDTGAGDLGEIERAMDAAVGTAPKVTLVHCPSGYPAPLPSIHLRMLSTLAALFPGVRLGFAGHNPGWYIEAAALALGATYIEKTVCLSRSVDLPEFMFSLEPGETFAFVCAMGEVRAALGQARRPVDEHARRRKAPARRSAYAARDLRIGESLTAKDIEWRRPGGGIEPDLADLLWGRVVTRALPVGHRLTWDDGGSA